MSNQQNISVTDKDQGQRLDLFLTERFEEAGYSRSYWNKMIQHEHVQVNGSAQKSGYKLRATDDVVIEWPEIDASYARNVVTIYEDANVLVLNKPAGMLTHSKGQFNPEFTLADFIQPKLSFSARTEEQNERQGIVHRLDRHTSGVIVTAKHEAALDLLQQQFQDRSAQKVYVAVVQGIPKQDAGLIDAPIARDPQNPKIRAARHEGKAARTRFTVVATNQQQQVSIVVFQPETGRTHQLRVHAKLLGHPILNDTQYGAAAVDGLDKRFLLHAYQLKLRINPETPEPQQFIATIPQDMSSYIDDDTERAITAHLNQA